MAINKAMQMALKLLSYPDLDMKKVYRLQPASSSGKRAPCIPVVL